MYDYLIKSLIYFIIFMAMAILYHIINPNRENKSPIIKVIISRACISLIPFARFFLAILYMIVSIIPEENLKEWVEKHKKPSEN